MSYHIENKKTTCCSGHIAIFSSINAAKKSLWLGTYSLGCIIIISSLLLIIGCNVKPNSTPAYTDEQRLQLDTTTNHTKNIDSLIQSVNTHRTSGDLEREMAALAALGHGYQTASQYADAVKTHELQLHLAEMLDDTLMKTSALNDIGVNYRRLGLYYDALDYHLRALETCQSYAEEDMNEKMLKCKAIAYNGAGNVYLSIGSYQKADEMLRKALAVEKRLNSHLGMNVDLANLGSVYENRGLIDSAWIFYKGSMYHSELANSYTGKAYGHMNFGRIYALQGNYRKAIEEFRESMNLVHTDRDLWLWMQPALSLADAYVEAGMTDSARIQLDSAQATAHRIAAKEYLSKIDRVRAKLNEHEGNHKLALMLYKQADMREDSMVNARNLFEIETLQRVISDRQHQRIEDIRKHEFQREQWWKRLSMIALFLVTGLLGIVLYIQRLRRKSLLELKHILTVREHFFTSITHEFRTPLTVILGLTQDLQQYPASEVQNKAQIISRHGNGLLTLINQLLDITKVKSSIGNPNWKRGNIEAHILMIVETYREYAKQRNIDLQFMSQGPVEMNFVPDYANKVLNNLLANAFKFTPEFGQIKVKLHQQNKHLFIDVFDTGQGIAPEDIQHVFEPFFQGQDCSAPIGTGVGLTLVKQIIDAVGGTISVESTINQGTTFHLIIPIRSLQCAKTLVEKTDETISSNEPLIPIQNFSLFDSEEEDTQTRLLIIEDNRDVAAYIGSLFTEHFAVSYASHGEEGLEKAIDLVPDLIITDLMMPKMDGLELCRCVRANEIINHIPIIVVTAKVTEEERIKGIAAGADAYVTKPFNNEELRTRVEKLLDRHRSLRCKYCDSQANEHSEESQPSEAERLFLSKTVDHIYALLDKRQLKVATLAERLCMSQRQFYRKIVAITGESPATFVLRIKMQRASILLKTKVELSIEDIALKTGFEHVSSFYHAFKKVYGVTPSKYRKMEKG